MDDELQFKTADVIANIRTLAEICKDIRTDSWSAWHIKQELYQLKWSIDEALRKCPTFSIEREWLDQQEPYQTIKLLKE